MTSRTHSYLDKTWFTGEEWRFRTDGAHLVQAKGRLFELIYESGENVSDLSVLVKLANVKPSPICTKGSQEGGGGGQP